MNERDDDDVDDNNNNNRNSFRYSVRKWQLSKRAQYPLDRDDPRLDPCLTLYNPPIKHCKIRVNSVQTSSCRIFNCGSDHSDAELLVGTRYWLRYYILLVIYIF